jgi:hydrogenase 3 maturation protease
MIKKLVLTVGNPMMGDDAAGSLLARAMLDSPIDGWAIMDGGSVPENYLHRIRAMRPDHVLVVDAADMDLAPGEIRLIPAEKLDDPFLVTTHTLPLSYLIQSLRETIVRVDLLGIQPKVVAFGFPVSPEVRLAVGTVYENLKRDNPIWEVLVPLTG